MKVLVISSMYPNPLNEIVGIFIEEQVKALVKKGCDIKVVKPVPYSPSILRRVNQRWKEYINVPLSEIRNEIEIFYPRYLQIPHSLLGDLIGYSLLYFQGELLYLGIKQKINEIIVNFRPHIVHVHGAFPVGYAVSLLKRSLLRNVKTVLTLHGGDINVIPFRSRLIKRKVKESLNNQDAIIAVSKNLKDIAISISGYDRICVIPNGVDIHKFTLSTEDLELVKKKKEIFKENKVILFVGNVSREKGVIELLEAFTRLISYRDNLILILVGRVKIVDILNRYLSSLSGKVKVIGPVKHEEIKIWMNLCDIFVLPSYTEGLPVSVLEAMSCGKPVVVSKVGGVSEVVKDKKNGLLVRPKDIDGLVQCIEFLLDNPYKAKSLGEEGRKTILENYTWSKNAERTIEVYKNIISN